MNTQRKNSLLLLLCAFIWGTAFVAQSAGSGKHIQTFNFRIITEKVVEPIKKCFPNPITCRT